MKFLRDKREELRHLIIRSTWMASREYNPPYLWSKGISQYCDFRGHESSWREETESCQPESFFRQHYADAKGLVWVRLSTQSRDGRPCDLDNFVRGALPTIRKPFVLITTDGDVSVPSEIAPATVSDLLDCPWLVSWHTQNYDGYKHPKLAPLPIGIDLHAPRFCNSQQHLITLLNSISSRRLPLNQLPLRVFCDLGVSFASEERRRVVADLSNRETILKRLDPNNLINAIGGTLIKF